MVALEELSILSTVLLGGFFLPYFPCFALLYP